MANALTKTLDGEELKKLKATGTVTTQPYALQSAAIPDYTPTDYNSMYDKMYDSSAEALGIARKAQTDQLNQQIPKIGQTYDTLRNKTYVNSRINALGNNESMAASGLAGNAYAKPTSGYAESSNVSQNNSLRNALNAAYLQQQGAEEDIANQLSNAGLSYDKSLAELQNSIDQGRLQSDQNENQFAANYGLQKASQEASADQFDRQLEEDARQSALEEAYKELTTFGKIRSQAAADALGVPVGATKSWIKKHTSLST